MAEETSVECYSGSHYGERPCALHWQGCRLIVEEVLIERRIPVGRFFRVRTTDKGVYDLTYDEARDGWSVEQVI